MTQSKMQREGKKRKHKPQQKKLMKNQYVYLDHCVYSIHTIDIDLHVDILMQRISI